MEKKCKIIYLNNFIYILSDDEIKEGDNVIDLFTKELLQVGNKGENISIENIDRCKKIIATTDASLKYYINGNGNKSSYELTKSGYIEFLPQPSQQFIEKYIESYNKGEVITDVLVEYEIETEVLFKIYEPDPIKLKVNPKDNTITINKLKDSWNREEIIKLLNKLNNTLNIGSDLTLEQWIEENL